MAQHSAYERRLNTLLADERYGPALARLTAADTARVLDLVHQNRGAEARKLIVQLDQRRREEETRRRSRRRVTQIVRHIIIKLAEVHVQYNSQMIEFGVSHMSRHEGDRTRQMNSDEIRAAAGDDSNIRYIMPEHLLHNKWWYH